MQLKITYSKGSLWRLLKCRIIRKILAVNNRHIKTATLYIIFCSVFSLFIPTFSRTCTLLYLLMILRWVSFRRSTLLLPPSFIIIHPIHPTLLVGYLLSISQVTYFLPLSRPHIKTLREIFLKSSLSPRVGDFLWWVRLVQISFVLD